MSKTIHAFTEPSGPSPAYLNVSTAGEGLSTVSVRARGFQSASGIVLADADLLRLASDILVHLNAEKKFDAATLPCSAPQTEAPAAPHITPTVGRVVWFYHDTDQVPGGFNRAEPGQPLAAIVTAVLGDGAGVHLAAFDALGIAHAMPFVPLVQAGQLAPSGRYATWMPYQVEQAKKHAAT